MTVTSCGMAAIKPLMMAVLKKLYIFQVSNTHVQVCALIKPLYIIHTVILVYNGNV